MQVSSMMFLFIIIPDWTTISRRIFEPACGGPVDEARGSEKTSIRKGYITTLSTPDVPCLSLINRPGHSLDSGFHRV